MRTLMFRNFISTMLVLALVTAGIVPVQAQISFMSFADEEPAVQAFMDKYGIDVVYIPGVWEGMVEQIPIMIATGTLPDVVRLSGMSMWCPTVDSGGFMDLAPYVERDNVDMGRFNPGEIVKSYRGDKLYALPSAGAILPTIALTYNVDMRRMNGLADPAWDWTWDEYAADSRRMTYDRDGDGIPDVWGSGLRRRWLGTLEPILYSFGGRMYDSEGNVAINSPEAAKALEFIVALHNEHRATANDSWIDDFFNGSVGTINMWAHHTPFMVSRSAELGINAMLHPMPQGPGGRQFNSYEPCPFDPYVIAATSDFPDDAWELVRFMTTEPEGQQAMVRASYDSLSFPLIAHQDQLQAAVEASSTDVQRGFWPIMQEMTIEYLTNYETYDVHHVSYDGGALIPDYVAVIDGVKTPQEALDSMERILKAKLQQ